LYRGAKLLWSDTGDQGDKKSRVAGGNPESKGRCSPQREGVNVVPCNGEEGESPKQSGRKKGGKANGNSDAAKLSCKRKRKKRAKDLRRGFLV